MDHDEHKRNQAVVNDGNIVNIWHKKILIC